MKMNKNTFFVFLKGDYGLQIVLLIKTTENCTIMRTYQQTEEKMPETRTIGFVFEQFMIFRCRRISTEKLYRYAFRLFAEYLGSDAQPIDAIDPKTISAFIKWLSEKYSGNSGYVVYRIIKSLFRYATDNDFIVRNPCTQVDSRCRLNRTHHHQAMSDKQIKACEDDFWESLSSADKARWCNQMLTNSHSAPFFRMCFILGFYLQGLAFIDIISLKLDKVKKRQTAGQTSYVIETHRQKTGKAVKIVIPQNHQHRFELFEMVYESALANSRTYLLDIKEGIDTDEVLLYNKVNKISCELSRKLKQWWRKLNKTRLKRHPIDIKSTSYYSCRHTFATLYLQNPDANLSELATLMGRNTEYIDSYIREIESEKNISDASDKVFGRQKRSIEEEDRKTILQNQKKILDIQKQILDRLTTYDKQEKSKVQP